MVGLYVPSPLDLRTRADELRKQSSVGHEVHIWFKFVFLSELLEASMVRASTSFIP
jgi:hypothetical protein